MRRKGLQEHDEIMPGGMGYSTSNSSHAPERTATVRMTKSVVRGDMDGML